MAKRTQLSAKDHPAHSKRRCNFDITDKDFEEFTRCFVPENTFGYNQKCARFLWCEEMKGTKIFKMNR